MAKNGFKMATILQQQNRNFEKDFTILDIPESIWSQSDKLVSQKFSYYAHLHVYTRRVNIQEEKRGNIFLQPCSPTSPMWC